jgi:hypothetical protein
MVFRLSRYYSDTPRVLACATEKFPSLRRYEVHAVVPVRSSDGRSDDIVHHIISVRDSKQNALLVRNISAQVRDQVVDPLWPCWKRLSSLVMNLPAPCQLISLNAGIPATSHFVRLRGSAPVGVTPASLHNFCHWRTARRRMAEPACGET